MRPPADKSLLDLALDASFDGALRNTVMSIIAPAIEPGGFLSFSIGGLGHFVLLFSEDDRSLRMIDLDGSMSLTVSQPRSERFSDAPNFDQFRPVGWSGSSNVTLLREILEFVRVHVIAFLINPLTMGAVLLLAVLWLMSRLSRTA